MLNYKKILKSMLSILPNFLFVRLEKVISKFNNSKTIDYKKRTKYYGQFTPPLDQLIYEKYFNNKIPAIGIAVECGAFDGITESTCKFFEESLGWTVFNIEPYKKIYEQLIKNRPDSRNYNFALSDKNELKKFTHVIHPELGINFGNGSLEHKNEHKKLLLDIGCEFEEIETETITINSFFELAQLDKVDLFVLDIEGYELKVLKNLLKTQVRPSIFCVKKQLDSDWNKIIELLEELSYIYLEDIHNNGIFILSNVKEKYLNNNNIEKFTNNSSKKPKINLISNILQESNYLKNFFDQLKNLDQKNYEIEKIFISINGPVTKESELYKILKELPFETEISMDPNLVLDEFSMFDRSRKWSFIFNQNIQKSIDVPAEFTVLFESDLTYPPDILDCLIESNLDAVAPVVFLGTSFYDSWGFRNLRGEKIYKLSDLNSNQFQENTKSSNLVELSSVGSFICLKTEFLKKNIRLPSTYENGLFVGLCEKIRRNEGKIFCRTDTSIIHPKRYWQDQLWDTTLHIFEQNKAKQNLIKNTYKITLPGCAIEFVNPYISKFHKSNKSYYILKKSNISKNLEIFCFSQLIYMNDFLNKLTSDLDSEDTQTIESFFLDHITVHD